MSSQNHRIKRLRRLVSQRKARSAERAFVAEGPVLVSEALVSIPDRVTEVYVDEELLESLDSISVLASSAGAALFAVKAGVLATVLDTTSPQPVAAVLDDASVSIDDFALDRPVLVLHELRDPGNVGTLLRTAEAAGFGGVVLTGESVDPSNPKVVRSAAGARFRVPLAMSADAATSFESLRARGHHVAATVVANPNDDTASGVVDYLSADLSVAAIVLGNEAHGLDQNTVDAADSAITIPLAGPTESLNVAAAGAIVCFASWNQRRKPAPE